VTARPRLRPVALPEHDLLTVAEVAAVFRVDAKTINRWANGGRLRSVRTPGGAGPGHHRFSRTDIEALLNGPEAGP
jgi:excisionase family DNA binding protein